MPSIFRSISFSTVIVAVLTALNVPLVGIAAGQAGDSTDEAHFLSQNDEAMTMMMNHMSIRPTGNVDEDFVAMMVPHHQGAIDMAQAELRYGHNEQLRRLAQEIVVDQQQEIVAMRLALGQPLPPSAPAPDQPAMPDPSPKAGDPPSPDSMQMNLHREPQ
ncbi:DUF305 domain-containing protein [Paraburkholderia fungorum]|uniref:DUF305 domain-containing protein n=1 Tax=Paraburkholderia fungorum TaxID=134537 RepID=UPI0038B86B33